MNRGGRPGPMMELERRAQQIKEVVRVSAALRADMPPEIICAQVAQTIHTTLGFRAAVVNLIAPGVRHFIIAATAGISNAERQRLLNDPPPVDHILSVMRDDFRVSNSYFISHKFKYLLEGAGGIMLLTPSDLVSSRSSNSWNPDDVFFVPLYSMRENRLIGLISLDLPEDGKIPTPETVEIIELLANQAATALDTARLFQERVQERQALEYGLAELLAHLERMRQRDFSARAQLRTTALRQVAGALNDVSETLGNVLADVRDAGMVVQQQASEMRNAASQLVQSAQQQAEQIRSASETIHHTSGEMRQIVERAAASSAIAEEAEVISHEGRQAAERAGEGMNAVREITLQAAKRIKRLGESSQEIGNVIQLVSEFASQTHLLALNAAIEAANAGEHGSGFAIVAREIRNLAQNSNEATKQIQARIKGIQNETNQVAVTVEHATQQVVLLSDLVSRTGSALHAIDTVIQRVTSVIATMHQTAEEQAAATATVSGTMNTIAGITDTTWESAEQMRASMDRLAELAGILQAKIEKFRLSERLQANTNVVLPTQPPATQQPIAPAGPPMTKDTATPAASFPAVSQPGRPSPAASYPTSPFASTPPADPYARSTPAMTNSGAPQGAQTSGDTDSTLLETVPMSAIQRPPTPPAMPTLQRAPTSAPLSPTDMASATAAQPAVPVPEPDAPPMMVPPLPTDGFASASDEPVPAPLFPTSSSPLTPMRLAALDDGVATDNANNANSMANGDSTATADPLEATGDEPQAQPDAMNDSAMALPTDDTAQNLAGDVTEAGEDSAAEEAISSKPASEAVPEATPERAQDAEMEAEPFQEPEPATNDTHDETDAAGENTSTAGEEN